MFNWVIAIGDGTGFALRTALQFPATLVRPSALCVQLVRIIKGMLPIVLLVGFALGIVTWMHVGKVLMRFESQTLLPSILMLTVVLEFGPLSIGMIAAGRLGSGIGAELAALEVTEQLDALDVMGVSPIRRLAAPRVLACILTLPALTVVVDYTALLGSFLAEAIAGDLSWRLYSEKALERLSAREAGLSTLKPMVFGFLVGIISCWQGMQAERSTEGVGRAATKSVVWSTVSVLIANVLLVRIIQILS